MDKLTKPHSKTAMLHKKHRAWFILGIVTVVLLINITAVSLILKRKKAHEPETLQLQGIWIYDEYIRYEFSEDETGCLCLENLHYAYRYAVEGEQLKLDFKDNAVRDCVYTASIENDKLTLIGGEGTVGGTYTLYKQQ